MTKRFSELFNQALTDIKARWKSIAILALVFAVLMMLAQMVALSTTSQYSDAMFGGMTEERMQDITDRMASGDEEALEDFMGELGITGDPEDPETAEQVEAMFARSFKAMLPALGFYALLSMLISVAGHATYLAFIILKLKDPWVALRKGAHYILPLLGIWLWMILRSFAWIPFIGIITAIILMPRMALAPVIMIEGKKGIMESVSMSMNSTRGYWGKIAGNFILLVILMCIAIIVTSLVLGLVLMSVPPVKSLAEYFVAQIIAAFWAFFMVHLSHTVLDHPLKPVK